MGVKDTFLGRLLASSDRFSDEQVTQTINLLIEHGVKHRASDIHIEPHERFVLVRYRIDGVLKGVHKLPVAAQDAVAEQIKTLAHLNTDEVRLPQEGQYATLVGEDQFEIQVSTLPVVGGEKIVMHISRRLSTPLSLEKLGYWGNGLDAVHSALAYTHGLILVSTPRRNGKTTTLHSMLRIINSPGVSIATIESAIEYRLQGASQTQIRPHHGITFHDGFRAALNQDPNVIMVSSLADKHTAGLAVQAAVSGHLIIAGMHNDHAPRALSHLRSMTEEPFLLATAVRASISQRLVRKLCVHCREHYIPGTEQIAEVEKAFGINSKSSRARVHELEQQAMRASIGGSRPVNTTPSRITGLWKPSEDGCEACHHSGYQGSVAITEVLVVTEAIQKALLEHQPANKIMASAVKEGFVPLELDGLIKALRGETTIAEILRTVAV